MLGRAFELVEQRGARRARALEERQESAPTPGRAGAIVAAIPREHEVVDHEGVGAGLKKLRHPHVGGEPVRPGCLEHVVLGDDPARGQGPSGDGHGLHGPPQCHLLLEKPVTRHPVLI